MPGRRKCSVGSAGAASPGAAEASKVRQLARERGATQITYLTVRGAFLAVMVPLDS